MGLEFNYFLQVHDWITNLQNWISVGPAWQVLFVILATVTLLQLAPDWFAGGIFFSNKGLWITLSLDALYVFLVYVSPFIPIQATIALLFVVAFIVSAILARNKWK